MIASRIAAVGLVAAAVIWVGSGYFLPHESPESTAAITTEQAGQKPFRVGVVETSVVPHSRRLTLSGRTEADKKVSVTARTNGVVTEVRVRRGDRVKKGDVLAVLSDEARVAQVAQARALLEQRRSERQARERLIEKGTLPRLDLYNLQAQEKAAEAALAAAEAELDRGRVTAPWAGVVNAVPAEIGQTMSGAAGMGTGNEVAQLLSLDPIIAVVEVSERRLTGVRVGATAEIRLVTGEKATGRVRFISKSASPTTRTYRVDVEASNPDGSIPDGISAEVAIQLDPVSATRVPRSALTFSTEGNLGVRVVRDGSKVAFMPVKIVEDEQEHMWVDGLPDGSRLIVQGQDFVREGQVVEITPASDRKTAQK